ncbi:MAG: PTS sugar transporter subunit IIA [Deltaproteobacteria bacterium]|nr:PTS sugar transporter subunit IIA [Deltaproteobacteria bacterium]MBK8238827.1 PTS sugar transporter subunit IIA [Deltaproteobacteria bacterium]MBK8715710.1 PTS sugar transporter subunit IIA [Deltaproteobacteria bacterium]MBP7288211.1 PTS sugar transporter subunit IIA [Nannocystaceae bacterium]
MTPVVTLDTIVHRVAARDVEGVVDELVAALAQVHGLGRAELRAGFGEREALGSTAFGHGVAIPHARFDVAHPLAAVGLAPSGLTTRGPDDEPVRVVVALVSPPDGIQHLQALAILGRMLIAPGAIAALLLAPDRMGVLRQLSRALEDDASLRGA